MSRTRFTKVEGAGNDYVLVDVFDVDAGGEPQDPSALARAVSDRHRGVGSDGLILVGPPMGDDGAVASMRIFNADGSEGRMCGNGLRCVMLYLKRAGRALGDELTVETAAGLRRGRLLAEGVELDMGQPDFAPAALPLDVEAALAPDGEAASVSVPPALGADPDRAWCVSVGNPHAVVRVPRPEAVDLARHGPEIAEADCFPEGANVHFIAPAGDDHWVACTWERGSGATRACGTGAVAVAAVVRERGWSHGDRITVSMPGGDLSVRFDEAGTASLMGPARLVFDGTWPHAGVLAQR